MLRTVMLGIAIRATTIVAVAGLAGCTESPSATAGGDSSTGSESDGSGGPGSSPTDADASADGGGVDDSGGAVDSSTGAPAEPCTESCVAVPSPWSGPVAVTRTPMIERAPPCPAAYPDLAAGELFGDVAAMDLVCTCGCAPDEVECPTHVTLYAFDDPACGDDVANYSVTTMCNSGPAGQVGTWLAPSEPVESGTCIAEAGVVPTPAGFDTRWTMCAGEPSAGVCAAGEVCAAEAAPFERMCIWQDGDHECPDGTFTQRQLVHSDLDDQRDCAECTCGDLEGTCSGTIRLWGADTCPMGGIEDIMTVELDECVGYDAQAAMLLDPLAPTGDVACSPSPPAPIGEVVPTGPVTVCCAGE